MIQSVGLHGLDNPPKLVWIRSELETEHAPVQFIHDIQLTSMASVPVPMGDLGKGVNGISTKI